MTQFQKDWSLFLAAKDGSVEVAKQMIAAGADPNFVQPRTGSLQPHQLSSVLCRAVSYGHRELVSFLLDNGAKIPDDSRQQDQIGYAAQCARRPDILELLLKAGLPIKKDYQLWAENKGHRELLKYLNEQLGPRSIQYDIDELLAKDCDFLIRYLDFIPSSDDIASNALFPEEIIIREIAEFDILLGSGFTTMFDNERLDCFARAYSALSTIGPNLAHEALTELLAALAPFGFRFDAKHDVEHLYRMDDTQLEAARRKVEEVDKAFFYGDHSRSLWRNRSHVETAIEYIRRHADVFRKRRPTRGNT